MTTKGKAYVAEISVAPNGPSRRPNVDTQYARIAAKRDAAPRASESAPGHEA